MIAAVDPGASGAIAFLSTDGHLVEVVDMPTLKVRGKTRVDAQQLGDIIGQRKPFMMVIEGVHSMPRQGVASSFAFGYSAGLIEGIAAGAAIPCRIVEAAVWKRKAGVPADKSAARQMAARMWPGAAGQFSRVKDDGRAESALLGWAYAVGKL